MKKIILLLLFLNIATLFAKTDSCLVYAMHCPQMGYYNPNFEKIDTCSGRGYFSKKGFEFFFNDSLLKSIMYGDDNRSGYRYEELDSLWRDLPTKYNNMKASFKQIFDKYGKYEIIKNEHHSNVVEIRFDNYVPISEFKLLFEKVEYVRIFSFSSQVSILIEAYVVETKFIESKPYPKFKIQNPQRYNSWCWFCNELKVEIDRKSSKDKEFSIHQRLYLNKNYDCNDQSFPINLIYTDSVNIEPFEKYYYKIYVNDCVASKVDSATTTDVTEDYTLENSVEIAPNPANDFFSIKFTNIDPGNISVNIINCLGITVYNKELLADGSNASVEVDTKELPAGSYFCMINSRSKINSKKILIIR